MIKLLNLEKTILRLSVSLALVFVPVVALAAESIALYEVDLWPQADGSFTVKEAITYNFGREFKHGILRDIPLQHTQSSGSLLKDRILELEINSVLMDGESIPYESFEQDGELRLKIGDPHVTITSEHLYEIEYEITGGYHYYENEPAELYWDAIGTEWPLAIEKAIVRVHDADGILTGAASCYFGYLESQDECGQAEVASSTFIYKADTLGVGRGLTVAFALNDSVETVIIEKYRVGLMLIVLVIVTIFAAAYKAYRYKTEFKTRHTVIAQYEPYLDFKPMYTGVLFDDTLNPADISAGIVYLAQNGYLKIKKVEKKVLFFFEVDDYEIRLLKAADNQLSNFQTDVLRLLFTDVITPGQTVTLSELKVNHSKQRANQKIIQQLKSDIKADLVEKGFIHSLAFKDVWPAIALLIGAIGFAYIGPTVMDALGSSISDYLNEFIYGYIFVSAVLIVVAVVIIMVYVWRRRTKKGYEALYHLKGFKDFLKTTEKERYKFHNAPAKSPEQFMQYLPYAIAFGVEEEWAEVFKDITIPAPDWYEGGTTSSFSATNLTTSLGAFSTAFASSSGSSSGSGSGGGGSVGGGGGGGGGGSW